jgi:DNA-binding NtrC family response regulator
MSFLSTNLINDRLIGVSPEIEAVRKQIVLLAKSGSHILVYGELGTEILTAARQIAAQLLPSPQYTCEAKGAVLEDKFKQWTAFLAEQPKAKTVTETLLIIDGLENLKATAQQIIWEFLTAPPAGIKLRIISTALPGIMEAVQNNGFSPDLFTALTESSLRVPPLRERKEDVPLLFESALQQIFGQMNQPIPAVSFELVMHLVTHQWPANLIELEKMAYELALQEAPLAQGAIAVATLTAPQAAPVLQEIGTLSEAIEELEKSLIQRALHQFEGSQRKTASALGLTEPNLRYRMKKLGMNKRLVYST